MERQVSYDRNGIGRSAGRPLKRAPGDGVKACLTSCVWRFREFRALAIHVAGNLRIGDYHGQARRAYGDKDITHFPVQIVPVRSAHAEEFVQLGAGLEEVQSAEDLEGEEGEKTRREGNDFHGKANSACAANMEI